MTPPATIESADVLDVQATPLSARPKIGFVSLGCPKNLVDSEVMMGMLHQAGGDITASAEDAEILVVNTCSFIDSAKQESVNTILEMVQHKAANGGKAQRLIVAGCLVERYRDEIQKNIPEVDAVVGTGELEAILAAAGLTPTGHANDSPFQILTQSQINRAASAVHQHSRPESDSPQLQIEQAKTASRPEGDLREQQGRFSRAAWDGATAALPDISTPTPPRASSPPRVPAPTSRSPKAATIPAASASSRSFAASSARAACRSIVTEAENLIAQGVREITLIGQDTTCYGEDLGIPDGLATLLDAVAVLPGLRWLRFLYAYPNKVTTRLLETIARHDTIAKYLDVPLQHASPSVLKRMKRGGTPEHFLKLIEKARATVPGIVLRSTFIVGFPGETEADYKQLEDFTGAGKTITRPCFWKTWRTSAISWVISRQPSTTCAKHSTPGAGRWVRRTATRWRRWTSWASTFASKADTTKRRRSFARPLPGAGRFQATHIWTSATVFGTSASSSASPARCRRRNDSSARRWLSIGHRFPTDAPKPRGYSGTLAPC